MQKEYGLWFSSPLFCMYMIFPVNHMYLLPYNQTFLSTFLLPFQGIINAMANKEMPAVPKCNHKCPSDPNNCKNVVCRIPVLDISYRCLLNPTSLLKLSSALFIRARFQVRRLESALTNQ